MEVVASPLAFSHSLALAKRRRACSPMIDVTVDSGTSDDFIMTDDNQYHHPKKRRIGSMVDEGPTTATPFSSTLFPAPFQSLINHNPKPFSGSPSPKRSSQGEETSPSHEQTHCLNHMRDIISKQAEELENLKSDKASMEGQNNELRSQNDKLLNENKILKKAVNIQQERQHHTALELDAARKYKDDAENRIRKLEQIIVSLRFHLQAQQHCSDHDFMNFNNRPPDVF